MTKIDLGQIKSDAVAIIKQKCIQFGDVILTDTASVSVQYGQPVHVIFKDTANHNGRVINIENRVSLKDVDPAKA